VPGRDELTSPSAWRGAAFGCCHTHRMIARQILALPNVVQQAAPGNVSTRGLPERCSIVWIKQRHYRSWRHEETFAGAACPHTLSLAHPIVPITPVQLRTVKSGLPDVASRSF
jgi:hypothetical protein